MMMMMMDSVFKFNFDDFVLDDDFNVDDDNDDDW